MTKPPQGQPPRFLGLKITSNRIESVLILFTFTCLSLIFFANDFLKTSKVLIIVGLIWALYLWVIKKPERPY